MILTEDGMTISWEEDSKMLQSSVYLKSGVGPLSLQPAWPSQAPRCARPTCCLLASPPPCPR